MFMEHLQKLVISEILIMNEGNNSLKNQYNSSKGRAKTNFDPKQYDQGIIKYEQNSAPP